MKFIVLGTSNFTIQCARAILDSGCEVAAIISMPRHALPDNSADLRGFAARCGVAYHEIEDMNSQEGLTLVKGLSPDYVFSSWPKILGGEFIAIPKRFVIGSHPTDLPHNRGRHPLHWLLVLGIGTSALTFFKMDEGVDTGNILLKEKFAVNDDDTICSLGAKVDGIAYRGLQRLCRLLWENPDFTGESQQHGAANYWRKRTVHDVTIDPRMPAELIVDTVRSFVPPYPGARLIMGHHTMIIAAARVVTGDYENELLHRSEYGRIMFIVRDALHVRCADGVVELQVVNGIPDELLGRKYVHPPSYYTGRNL